MEVRMRRAGSRYVDTIHVQTLAGLQMLRTWGYSILEVA